MNTISLGLHPTNLGTQTREVTDPFTGEKLVAYTGDAVTESQLQAGHALLKLVNATEPDPDGFQMVNLDKNRFLSVSLNSTGGIFEINGGLQFDAIKFLFQFATTTELLITSTIDPTVIAVLSGQRSHAISQRWPSAFDVSSSDELYSWLESKIKSGSIA